MSNDTPKFRAHYGLTTRRKKKRRDVQAWRYPRGIDRTLSSVRGPMPKIGYGHKKDEKGMHPSKFIEVLITSKTDLDNILIENVAIRFSKRLGLKKKTELTILAKEKNFKVLN
jgi:large subunit ribosomal protein L32e